MTGVWATADTITAARMNEKTIFQGTGAAISGLATTYPGQIVFCTSTGSGFTLNGLYVRNSANTLWEAVRIDAISKYQLKAYYKFNEASGNIINLARLVGSFDSLEGGDLTTTSVTYSQTGVLGSAISFNGTSSKANAGVAANWKFLHNDGDDWTVAFWLKYTGTIENGHAIFATVTDTSADGILFDIRTSGDFRCLLYNASASVGGTFTVGLADANWHHYVLTHDNAATDLELWYDGTSKGTIDTNAAGTSNPTQALTLMNRNSEVYAAGMLDEFAVWKRKITSTEIAALYNSGSGQAL